MTIKKGPFGIGGTYENCPVFGCAYDVSQTSSVDIISYSSNVVNEAEDIFRDISTELKQKAKAKKTGMNAGAHFAVNKAIDSSRDVAIENIRSKLLNLSETNNANLQKVTIEYVSYEGVEHLIIYASRKYLMLAGKYNLKKYKYNKKLDLLKQYAPLLTTVL